MPKTVRSYKDILVKMDSLTEKYDNLTKTELGHVKYDDFREPVIAISSRFDKLYRHKVLITAGIHGDEPASVNAIFNFIEEVSKNPEKFRPYSFYFVPVVNPYGYVYDTRNNGADLNVNRGFNKGLTQEARLVRDHFTTKSFDMAIDMHEDPKDAYGSYIYIYYTFFERSAFKKAHKNEIARKAIDNVSEMGYPIEEGPVHPLIFKSKNGIVTSRPWQMILGLILGRLGCSAWARLNLTNRAYTTETPCPPGADVKLEDRIDVHRIFLNTLVDSLEEEQQ